MTQTQLQNEVVGAAQQGNSHMSQETLLKKPETPSMIEPINTRPAKAPRQAQDSESLEGICAAIEADLRRAYSEEFDQAHEACATLVRRTEPGLPNYVDLDAAIVADVAGSNEVKRILPQLIGQYLPGAMLHDQVDEPAVIDSTWVFGHHELIVEWDYTRHFGDPDGLTVTAQLAVAQ